MAKVAMREVRHILVACDQSDAARAAAEYACALATDLGARVTLLEVVTAPTVAMPDAVYVASPEELAALEADVDARLSARATALARPGLTLDHEVVEVVSGSVAEQINAVAARLGVDLLVIGTHGRRGLSHLILGSVAEAVVRRARCPVLAIHAGDEVRTSSAA